MTDKFNVNFDKLADTITSDGAIKLSDVEHRIEKVAYDIVRFRDNDDTQQLWKIQDGGDGPVIVALYNDDGSMITESNQESKGDWEAVPDKKAMHIFYKGEPLAAFSSEQMGIPASEFSTASRWISKKLASDESIQKTLFSMMTDTSRKLTAQRFPELTKVAYDGLEDDSYESSDEFGEPDFDGLAEDIEEYRVSGKLNDIEASMLLKRLKAEI